MKKQTNTDQQEPKDRKKEILEWLQIIIAAAVIAFCLNTFVVANSRVPSASMENTIFTHKAEPGKDKTRLVKRVIGLPGETVDIREDKVFINGSDTPLQETYLPEAMDSKDYHFEVPEGCYLMLGDNRNHSIDARGWEDPYVTEDEIKAKVLFRYFPSIGKIE